MNLAGLKAVLPAAWMDIELAVGMVAIWAGHWVARMAGKRVGKKVV